MGRFHRISIFYRIQVGLYDEGLEVGKLALETEEKECGARYHRMGDLHSMMAQIWDAVKLFYLFGKV